MADGSAIDAAFQHLRAAGIEGFETRGYIPGKWSGVTIGVGVDLRFQSVRELKSHGISDALIRKIERTGFLGKLGSTIEAEGLDPSSLVLTENEAATLSKALIADEYAVVKPYARRMSQRGTNVLVSLKHWAGALGNTKGVLAPEFMGKRQNLVWEAVRGKTATDGNLVDALTTLKARHNKRFIRNRIQNEIDHINGTHK